MEQQQKLNFNDDQSTAHKINLDEDRHQLLVELMGNIVFHVFHAQQRQSDGQPQESHQD